MSIADFLVQVRDARKDLFKVINDSSDIPDNMKMALATAEWDSRVAKALLKASNHIPWGDSREAIIRSILQTLRGEKDDKK